MLKIILDALVTALRSRRQLALENLALRHQLAVLQRTAKRPPPRPPDRAIWAVLARVLPDWRVHLAIVQPDAPQIHGQLLKLGYDISETTVAKFMVHRPSPPSQTWKTFVRNHMTEIAAIDFFTVPSVSFKTLYVLVVLSLERRRVVHFDVTSNPTASWTSRQLIQAFPFDLAPRYLIRDRDGTYGRKVVDALRMLGIKQVVSAPRSPWQNGYCERIIGSIRRECLDHVIVRNERHLRRVLKDYVAYYHESRTHLGLAKDCPEPRAVQARDTRPVVSESVLGGLHHRYYRDAA